MRVVSLSARLFAIGLAWLVAAGGVGTASAAPTGFIDKVLVEEGKEYRYVIYIPQGYDGARRWPVVLYLHGAGYSGVDGRQHLNSGLAKVIRAEEDFPAIVVFPQCEELDARLLSRWLADSPDGQRALRMLEQVEQEYLVDASRRVLTGWSMGGYGVWSLAAAHPDRWSAVVPVSGGGNPELASQISAPVWAIHGAADRAILPRQSLQMVEAVNRSGGQAALSLLSDISHDAWRYAFLSPTVRTWMLSATPGVPDTARLQQETSEFLADGRAEALDGEFQPALIIPRAISLRVANDALQTLAYGVPHAVDPGLLSGTLEEQTFDFAAVGESFRVTLEELSYHANLERVLIETQASGVIRLRIGLHPLAITIGSTQVQSATRTARAGPTTIRIGHRYPLWMEFLLRPSVNDGRVRLEVARADFHIPDANWVVSPPEQIAVSGPDLTPQLAEAALVGGLYLRREQIEQYIHDAIPAIVQGLENRMQPTRIDRIVTSVWPLPVFRPRLRIQPEEIAVDGDGLSLVMRVEAAPFRGRQHPLQPQVTAPMGPHAEELTRRSGLELGISPGVLQSLSSMVVDARAAHIDVRDMPEPEFRQLADRAELTRILPELAALDERIEVRTDLNLTAPLVVERADVVKAVQFTSAVDTRSDSKDAQAAELPGKTEPEPLAARFEIPELQVSVMTRDPAASSRWQEFAMFNVQLAHQVGLQLSQPGHQQRIVRLSWSGQPNIQVVGGYANSSAERDQSVDRAYLGDLIGDCWNAWTGGEAVIEQEIPDLVLGTSRLRIEDLNWRTTELTARFHTPQTRITNTGPRLIEYAVRGPYSGWSRRYQLLPGETDIYASPSGLIVRRYPQPAAAAIELTVGGELDLADAEH